MRTDTKPKTRIAVLGTLAEFDYEPMPTDLPALVHMVTKIQPDLLCLDMTPEQWQTQDFSTLPPEYAAALLPLARQTDIVVAPVGSNRPERMALSGWRGRIIAAIRRVISAIQRTASDPAGVNQGWRHDLGNFLYGLSRRLAGPQAEAAYYEHIRALTEATLDVARHNPGNRILVVTNIQYCHHIRPQLSHDAALIVTSFREL